MLTLPQAMWPSLDGSLTTNLSLGDRPVCAPVRQTSGPSAASSPFFAADGVLVQRRRRQIPVHGAGGAHAVLFEPVRAPRVQ